MADSVKQQYFTPEEAKYRGSMMDNKPARPASPPTTPVASHHQLNNNEKVALLSRPSPTLSSTKKESADLEQWQDELYLQALERERSMQIMLTSAQTEQSAQEQTSSDSVSPSKLWFSVVLVLAIIADGAEIITGGTIGIIIGLIAAIIMLLIMVLTKGWGSPLTETTTLILFGADSIPFLSFLPSKIGLVIYKNMDKFSGVMKFAGGTTNIVAKYAKYLGSEGKALTQAAREASRSIEDVNNKTAQGYENYKNT